MKKILFAATFAVFASTQAFAIIGAGLHYVMNTGSLDKSGGPVYPLNVPDPLNSGTIPQSIDVEQKKADGLQGMGFKLWIDFLPFVDIEGTFNIAATRYTTLLKIPTIDYSGLEPKIVTKDIPLEYAPEAPYNLIFDKASPLYGIVNGDVSVTYPFDILPIIRPYAGVGFSYFASIPVINDKFTKDMLASSPALITALETALENSADPNAAAGVANEIGDALVKALTKESYKTGVGGHIIAGVRIKPPIIPLAIYTNGKYYFGGDLGQFKQGFVLEVGGGLAI